MFEKVSQKKQEPTTINTINLKNHRFILLMITNHRYIHLEKGDNNSAMNKIYPTKDNLTIEIQEEVYDKLSRNLL